MTRAYKFKTYPILLTKKEVNFLLDYINNDLNKPISRKKELTDNLESIIKALGNNHIPI